MGVCVSANEKKNNPYITNIGNTERILNCTITHGDQVIKSPIISTKTVKEFKHHLAQELKESGHNKQINLYHKGILLKNNNQCLGNLVQGDYLDLVMVSISLDDSTLTEKADTPEVQTINKLSTYCKEHKDTKELNLCVLCKTFVCDKCLNKHKNHKIISKFDLTKYNFEIKEILDNLNTNFKDLDLDVISSDLQVAKDDRNDLDFQCNKLVEKIDKIKKKELSLYSEFKKEFDNIYPILYEYKEKMEGLYDESTKETTIRMASNFLNFYGSFTNTKNYLNKINENMKYLKHMIEIFKEILFDFKVRTKKIMDCINEQLALIKDYSLNIIDFPEANIPSVNINRPSFNKNFEPINLKNENNNNEDLNEINTNENVNKLERVNTKNTYNTNNNTNNMNNLNIINNTDKFSNRKASSPNPYEIRSMNSYRTNSFGKMNIINLMTPSSNSNKKALAKMISNNYKERKTRAFNPYEESNKIIENVIQEQESNSNLIYTIQIKTNNLYCYDIEKSVVSKIQSNLSNCSFNKFSSYHATLNYNGRFYVGGGISNSDKNFYLYNKPKNEFMKLADSLYNHSFHCLLGVNDFIFSISGYKSKKVEKYLINSDQWIELSNLNRNRSWPSAVTNDNKNIYVFGGLVELNEGENPCNFIERLDITNDKNNWEIINVKCDLQFSFYFGVIKIDNNKILMVGGKFDPKDECTKKCLSFSFDNNTVVAEDNINLPKQDQFEGKLFLDLGNNKYGQFSSIYSNCFYVFDNSTSSFDVITMDENKE